jgi:hypothetical protein
MTEQNSEFSLKNKQLKSALHHWWPQCVSKHWLNDEGVINHLFWNEYNVPQTNPRNFGAIRDAHLIKYASYPTDWDESFEGFFGSADEAFPKILDWLIDLQEKTPSLQDEEQGNLDILLECLLSLVVRSPRFRNQIKINIEKITNQNTDENLIKINQRDTLNSFKKSLLGQGKFAVIYSKEKEFIFGDGFYNNFVSSIGIPLEPRIITPLLPNICVFYSRPTSYMRHPRLITMELEKEDIDFINRTTMIYSQSYLFYRSQKPVITEDFWCKQFLEYNPNGGDPVITAFSKIFKYPSF